MGWRAMNRSPVTLPRSECRVMSRGQDRDYQILVAWPEHAAPPSGFPVVYLLDANATFGTVVEAIRARSRRPESTGVAPAVVVGIAYPTDAPYARARRHEDYTPWPPVSPLGAAEAQPVVPQADAFLSFLIDDVRAAIVADYPVDTRRQALLGHSLGGLFVLHALTTRPDAFNRYAAISPSIWWNAPALFDALDRSPLRRIADGERPGVLLAAGGYEEQIAPWQHAIDTDAVRQRRASRQVIGHATRFGEALTACGVQVDCLTLEGEDHATVFTRALSPVLRMLAASANS